MNNKRVDLFLDTIVKLHKDLDFSTFWPANPPQLQASYSDLLALKFYQRYTEDIKIFNNAVEQIKPNSLRSLLYQVGILGLKVANSRKSVKIPQEKILGYTIFLLDKVASKTKNDEFCRDGFYRILDEGESETLTSSLRWNKIQNEEESRKIATFGVTLESLVWSLQFDTFRTAGTLIHGPYFTKRGTLIIKDFIKLQSLVWKNKMIADKISIYLLYKPGFVLKFNYANQQTSYSESPINSLLKYSIKFDDKDIVFNDEFESETEKVREKQVKFVDSLSPLEIIEKGAEIYHFMYKEFFDYYQTSWEPTKDILERIKKNGLKYFRIFKNEGKVRPEFYRKQFDPRNTFIG